MNKVNVSGAVQQYSQEGRKLGYPTANIECSADTPEGVFVGYTSLMNQRLPSIIFIGAPITLGETIKRVESHILDLEDKDLYGQEIQIEVIEKLRGNKKFNSRAELVAAMKADEKAARAYFKKVRP